VAFLFTVIEKPKHVSRCDLVDGKFGDQSLLLLCDEAQKQAPRIPIRNNGVRRQTALNGGLPVPTASPTVSLGGTNVTALGAILRYAGLYRVNIQLPQTIPTGDLPIKIIQGSFESPDGVLINVQ
jgi:hypothetical protein